MGLCINSPRNLLAENASEHQIILDKGHESLNPANGVQDRGLHTRGLLELDGRHTSISLSLDKGTH